MNATRAALRVGISLGLAVSCTPGCSNNSGAPAPAADQSVAANQSQTIRPVSLPDLSPVSISVREQLQERFASLHAKATDASAASIERATSFGELGKLFMASDFVDEAESCFLNAHALAPSDARWPYYLGHLHRNRGDLPKAAAFFERALQLDSTNVTFLIRLGELYFEQGRSGAAEPLFAKAIAIQPDSGAALYGLGRVALANNDYQRAADYLEQALSRDKRATRIHYPLALAYRRLGKLDIAQAHVQAQGGGEMNPPDPLIDELGSLLESAMTYQSRGILALERSDWQLAATHFRRGLELEPASASMHHRLGTALYMAGDSAGATAQFHEALRIAPTFSRAHYSLGVLAASNGDYREAIDRFSRAVASDRDYREARVALADTLRGTGRLLEALEHYEILLLDSQTSDALLGHAVTLIRLERYEPARVRLIEGTVRFPEVAAFSLALARVLAAAPDERVRDGQRAYEEIKKLASEPPSIELTETVAMVLAELGRFEEAASRQREAIDAARRSGVEDLARRMSQNLKLYEARRPCRTPWRPDELQ